MLPIVVYLDDIAAFGDLREQVLVDTINVFKKLTAVGFMMNVEKSQLAQTSVKISGHLWTPGGY